MILLALVIASMLGGGLVNVMIALGIMPVVIAFNIMVGDGLRDALDPRLKDTLQFGEHDSRRGIIIVYFLNFF